MEMGCRATGVSIPDWLRLVKSAQCQFGVVGRRAARSTRTSVITPATMAIGNTGKLATLTGTGVAGIVGVGVGVRVGVAVGGTSVGVAVGCGVPVGTGVRVGRAAGVAACTNVPFVWA